MGGPGSDAFGAVAVRRSPALVVAAVLLMSACSESPEAIGVDTTATTLPPTTTEPPPTSTTSIVTTTMSTTTTAPPVIVEELPPILVGPDGTKTFDEWYSITTALAPTFVRPSDCGTPLDEPESLPNSDRSYRGGVHKGVDFICEEYGHFAVAALPGRVLIANNSFIDPSPAERGAVLQTAQDLGYTPPWTLAMLYGKFVVIDHGIVAGAGHVVSLYAHIDEVDAAIRPGLRVDAGTVLGEIGNLGTATAASGGDRTRSIHLHWDLYVDTGFLGQGLTASETSEVYSILFGDSE